ncbi:DUF1513 domain-containing protein [Polaromonas sp. P1-6]|nr:DUF1513 domain-containing protein [Polaromonas sp. P1-6]
MPTAIKAMGLNRRQWLARGTALAVGGTALQPALGTASMPAMSATLFAAAWQAEAGYQVGLLERSGPTLAVRAALDVPTRAHGLWREPGGTLLTVARRPGDWLLRWRPDGQALAWTWIEADRAFNGHVISSADGRHVFTTETDLETGQGLIGVRDAASLQKLAEWPSHGMDPHELLHGADGSLMVANGGIPTLPETGRLKLNLDRMDSSLVRLDPDRGTLLGQWRLDDARLSLRHMAWGQDGVGPAGRVLGIALQAEHANAAQKQNAPVLALFNGRALRMATAPRALAGYGGDIAFAAGRFAVSCPRANGVALYDSAGHWQTFAALDAACALAADPAHAQPIWAGGERQALALSLANTRETPLLVTPARLDNHWLVAA